MYSISSDSNNLKKVSFKKNVYDFSVDYHAIDKSNILNILKYLAIRKFGTTLYLWHVFPNSINFLTFFKALSPYHFLMTSAMDWLLGKQKRIINKNTSPNTLISIS